MSELAVSHLLIALLMAGQHTSSTTGAWSLLYLAQHPDMQAKVAQEHFQVTRGGEAEDEKLSITETEEGLTYDRLKKAVIVESVVKETVSYEKRENDKLYLEILP